MLITVERNIEVSGNGLYLIIQIFILSVLLGSCTKLSRESFRKVSPDKSGIHFLNELTENDTLNYTIFPYMYMGGGVK